MEQYAEAVASALAGNQEGYDFLYQSTYQKKFFIAKKYMGNDMDAQDVLQDAYVQAFTKLNTLQDYQKFPNWFGMIVANTAKNALQKKKMLFFSDLEGVNEEGEAMELNIMDTDASRQPEIAYTEKETQEMVHEMLDTLPDDQRMCILMFHFEGASIREIAEAMECSENTVKSRLNYGRKAIKKKSEELQKKRLQTLQYGTTSASSFPASQRRGGIFTKRWLCDSIGCVGNESGSKDCKTSFQRFFKDCCRKSYDDSCRFGCNW